MVSRSKVFAATHFYKNQTLTLKRIWRLKNGTEEARYENEDQSFSLIIHESEYHPMQAFPKTTAQTPVIRMNILRRIAAAF